MKKMVGLIIIAIAVLLVIFFADNSREETPTKKCMDSVEKYMTYEEALAFCSQPSPCRKWWDDLTEEEQEELQPPKIKNNMEWWTHCNLEKRQSD